MTHKEHLFDLPDGTRIFRVDGPAVRRQHVAFVEGGHGYVYPWIPKREVWIERMLNRQDECHNTIHELTEQHAMRHHGWSYNRAHAMADRIEQRLRRRRIDACKLVRQAVGLIR